MAVFEGSDVELIQLDAGHRSLSMTDRADARAAQWLGVRARVATYVLATVGLITLGSCNAGADQATITPTASGGISIPTAQLTAFDQCMLDNGFHVTEVHPGYAGSKTWYTWESDASGIEDMSKMEACRAKYAPYHEKTVEELRVVYDRWVQERKCLIGLGYQPTEPPSFEKFTADWKTGPWLPIDGLDTGSWKDAEYRRSKERCGLEMYDR
jgi:hypothetical protein